MKVEVNGKKVIELNETQKKVICNDIDKNIFDADMERRVNWVLDHKYRRCFQRLKQEWEPKLAQRMDAVPTDPDKFAELVFSQPDYKCRATREAEAKDKEKKQRTGQQ